MKRHLEISERPIEVGFSGDLDDPTGQFGAVCRFEGVVRGIEEGQAIAGIEYEAFREMAEHQFHKLFDRIETRWPIGWIRVRHRIGWVPAGVASLRVEVASGHRGEAFEACQWLIDEMKRIIPIWKRPRAQEHGRV